MTASAKGPRAPRNLISQIGIVIAIIAVTNLIFLIFVDVMQPHGNPYLGILTWIVAPAILIFGLAMFFAGILLDRRRRRRQAPDEVPAFPRIDLNQPLTRAIAFWTTVGTIVFVTMSVVGSYKAYHYTDSDA